jgi:hypothetical protein
MSRNGADNQEAEKSEIGNLKYRRGFRTDGFDVLVMLII